MHQGILLRPGVDTKPIGPVTEPGKSVSIANDLTLKTEIPKMFHRDVRPGEILSGAFVEDIRAAGFDVKYAPTQQNPSHARIVSRENTFDATGAQWLRIATDRIAKERNR